MKKLVVVASVVLVSVAAAACNQGRGPTSPSPANSGQTPTPGPSPTPTPPVPPVPPVPPPPPPPVPPTEPFTQTLSGFVGVFDDVSHAFTMPRGGTATFTLRWIDPTVDLDILITPASCTNPFAATCDILQGSTGTSGTVETLTRQVEQGQELRLWASNFSNTKGQNYTIEIDIR